MSDCFFNERNPFSLQCCALPGHPALLSFLSVGLAEQIHFNFRMGLGHVGVHLLLFVFDSSLFETSLLDISVLFMLLYIKIILTFLLMDNIPLVDILYHSSFFHVPAGGCLESFHVWLQKIKPL